MFPCLLKFFFQIIFLEKWQDDTKFHRQKKSNVVFMFVLERKWIGLEVINRVILNY